MSTPRQVPASTCCNRASARSSDSAYPRDRRKPTRDEPIDHSSTIYVAGDPTGGSCGHRHRHFDEAARCVEAGGLPDRAVREVPAAEAADLAVVHETALVDPGVSLGPGVTVGAYAVLGPRVVVGAGSSLADHAILRPGTRVGANVHIDSFAVVAGDPQDLTFDPVIESGVRLGDGVVLREGVTVHRSTVPGGETVVEDGVYIMATGHVAHDCVVRQGAVLANGVLIAGHVEIGQGAILGGGAGIHQFARIGTGCMIGGNATVTRDVPPFTMLVDRNGLAGLNLVGLRRRGVPKPEIAALKRCYKAVYVAGQDPSQRAAELLAGGECGSAAVVQTFLAFFAGGSRGFVRPRRD